MRNCALAVLVFWSLACGREDASASEDATGPLAESAALDQAVLAHMRECGVLSEGSFKLSYGPGPALGEAFACDRQCMLDASCELLEETLCPAPNIEGGSYTKLDQCLGLCRIVNRCPDPSGQFSYPAPRCDGKVDCHDGRDEEDCPDGLQTTCDDGEPISIGSVCDNHGDCGDRSDEKGCDTFACEDGSRIDTRKRCDRSPDCADASDENGCAEVTCTR